MIKIQLSSDDKDKIKNMFWTDMCKFLTGLPNVLNTKEAKKILRKFDNLYSYFYDVNGLVRIENVKALLLADKPQMEKYIQKFGEFPRNKSKELTDKIFRYDTFSSRKCAYDILKIERVTVCPYCNRQYIFTLKNRKVRPQFDHYYPKSIYPYLAVSIFNLIPSCSICNQAKSTWDTYKNPILYPFEEEFGDEVHFVIDCKDIKNFHGLTDKFNIIIDKKGAAEKKRIKIQNQDEKLHLEDLYNEHKDYVKDIAKNHYINSQERIEEVMRNFPGLFLTKEEAVATIYMNDIRERNLGKRPLAKLTRDIYKQLEIHI